MDDQPISKLDQMIDWVINLQRTAQNSTNFATKILYHSAATAVIAGVVLTVVFTIGIMVATVILLTEGVYAVTGIIGAAIVAIMSMILMYGTLIALIEWYDG